MQSLVISIENPLDTQLLMNLVTRLGMKVRTLTSHEERLLARQSLVATSIANVSHHDSNLPTDEDILSIVEEVRNQRYPND